MSGTSDDRRHPTTKNWTDGCFHSQVLLPTRADKCSVTPSSSALCRWAAVLSTSAMLPTSTATCWPMPSSVSWVSHYGRVHGRGVNGSEIYSQSVLLSITYLRASDRCNFRRCVPLFADMPPRMLGPKNQLIKVIENTHTFLDCPFFGSPLPDLRW